MAANASSVDARASQKASREPRGAIAGDVPPPPLAGREVSDTDLMLEALDATQGQSPNAARIEQVVTQTAIEAQRKQRSMTVPTFWKDPFVDDSEPPVLVRPRPRVLSSSHGNGHNGRLTTSGGYEDAALLAARRDAARARADAALARAEAAALRTGAELARREARAARAEAQAARREAAVARAGCSNQVPARRAAARVREQAPAEAPADPGSSVFEKDRLAGEDAPVPTPAVAPQPANAGYHGILVVPLDSARDQSDQARSRR